MGSLKQKRDYTYLQIFKKKRPQLNYYYFLITQVSVALLLLVLGKYALSLFEQLTISWLFYL